MPEEGADDFDQRQDRQEEEEDIKFSDKLILEELSKIKMQTACVFIKDSAEVLHGRLLGRLSEMDVWVLRDLRPTRQALRARLLVPHDNVEHFCVSEESAKCKQCHIYRDLVRVMEESGDAKGGVKQDNLRDAIGASGTGSADQVGSKG